MVVSNFSGYAVNTPAPPPFDPLKPAIPISYPLHTMEELESRVYFNSFHYPYNKASIKLPPDPGESAKRRRTLVCHDMAGGYTDDRLVQGGKRANAFAIWHWFLIDIFVYFSHGLVTLPPPGWTNTAHRHGVKVLGTFIMESTDGKEHADKLLASMDSVHMYADRLTELAVSLGFDGWLINIEVNLDPGKIPNLKEFISYLTKTMHSSLPGSLVIWYDSVTVEGDLFWQNQLNTRNKAFFDLCDGIFVNYSWEENYLKQSVDVAGDRNFDVYMGIDVYGRDTYGGGKWTTNVALDMIKKNNVSAAIFAPGWVYETKQPPDFQTAQNRWWGLVEQSWGTVKTYPKVLPFCSNFDQGHGYHVYKDGMKISSNQWNHISSQSFQPFVNYSGNSTTEPIQVSVDYEGASYSGGGSLAFVGKLGVGADFAARLFLGDLPLGNSPVNFTYSVKSSGSSLLGLSLRLSSPTSHNKSVLVLVAAPGNTLLTMNQFSSRFSSIIMPRKVTKLEQWTIQESSINMAGHTLKEIQALCYKLKPQRSAYNALLGDIKIARDGDKTNFPPANAWHIDTQFITWNSDSLGNKNLSLEINWQLKVGNVHHFPKYNIFVDKFIGSNVLAREYLGQADLGFFYVGELAVPSRASSFKFIIQVCGLDGDSQKIEDSPFLKMNVEGK